MMHVIVGAMQSRQFCPDIDRDAVSLQNLDTPPATLDLSLTQQWRSCIGAGGTRRKNNNEVTG